MAGYMVQGPVVAVWPRSTARPETPLPIDAADETTEVEIRDLVGQPFTQELAWRLERWREIIAQTTFYLFDPNSWR